MIRATLILSAVCALALANPLTLKADPSWRVVGGSDAADGQFPFIISLRVSNSLSCGGSILGGVWIITAAHCVDGASISRLTVVTGTNSLTTGGDVYKVKRTIIHENYDSDTTVNDIALIELTTPVVENDKVKRIELDEDLSDTPRDVTLAGWGRTSYPGNISNQLQYLLLKTISLADCQKAWAVGVVTDKQVCTFTRAGQGACHGDSGGPLVTDASGSPKLTGLVSWGQPCAVGSPDVFTKVASYVDWIKSKTQ